MKAKVEILYADGTLETFPLEQATATLGRSLEADVSIPDARELEPQHFRLRPENDGCVVDVTESARTPVLVSGKRFGSGKLPWGVEMRVGELRIRLLRADAGRGISLGAILMTVLIVAAAVFLYAFLTRNTIQLDLRSNHDAPEILPGPERCPVAGDTALRRAAHYAESAEAKSDRYAFDPQDGIAAVELYGYATACFRAGGDDESAQRVEARAKGLRKHIEEDYTTHRLSLERALETEELHDALREAIVLYKYVRHTHGSYQKWLLAMIQKLQLRVEQEDGHKS